jgi:hypothetical protein
VVIKLRTFLTSTVGGGEWLEPHFGMFSHSETAFISHWIGGWLGNWTGLVNMLFSN